MEQLLDFLQTVGTNVVSYFLIKAIITGGNAQTSRFK